MKYYLDVEKLVSLKKVTRRCEWERAYCGVRDVPATGAR